MADGPEDDQEQQQRGDEPSARPGRGHDDDPSATLADATENGGDDVDASDSTGLADGGRLDQIVDDSEADEDEIVDPEIVEAVAKRTADPVSVRRTTVTQYRGPIPQAAELQAYNEVLPGAADRILRMSEKALDAQIEVDTTLAHGDVGAIKRGQLLSTGVVGFSIAAALVLALLGAPWEVVGIFIIPGLFEFGSSLVRAIREPSRESEGRDPNRR